jgi:ribonuclease HII
MAIVLGIDEVGRGCWAGPVVAGAAILLNSIKGLRDSKKLSKIQRTKLDLIIRQNAVIGLGWVTPKEVDEIGLTRAVRLAMQRAVAKIDVPFDEIIVDGSYNFLIDDPRSKAIVRADDSVSAVSAASIVAKVARDNYMTGQAKVFPKYKFEKHVGYGTALHATFLKTYGPCELHRLSYKPIRALMA